MIIGMRNRSRKTQAIGWTCAALYAASVYLANWLLVHVGLVDVGFGLQAPAGVFAAGAALVLRDLVQRYLGRDVVIGAIVVGALVSLTTSPSFALASATAFLLAELCDMAVYTPLERRGLVKAVFASNLVGMFVDSVIFLWLAFGSLAFLWGQIVGKMEMTLLAIVILASLRRVLPEPEVVTA